MGIKIKKRGFKESVLNGVLFTHGYPRLKILYWVFVIAVLGVGFWLSR